MNFRDARWKTQVVLRHDRNNTKGQVLIVYGFQKVNGWPSTNMPPNLMKANHC